MTANNQSIRTNVLILGKTGVGKSSLLNYLFGDKAAVVGHGRPTTTEGIHQNEPFEHNGVSFVIYDSWGMEADKATQWKDLVAEEVEKNNAKEVRDWFHTVLYCVDAERARVERFEVEDVISPLLKEGNRILFALTKPGLNEGNTRATTKELEKHFQDCDVVEVESVSATFIGGRPPILPRGREELLDRICRNLWDNIISQAIEKYKRDTRMDLYNRFTAEIMRYFMGKASGWDIFKRRGANFQNDIARYAEQRAQSIFAEKGNELKENICVGQKIASGASNAIGGGNIIHVAVNQRITDIFSKWKNGWEENIVAMIKRMSPDTIKKDCIKLVDLLEELLDTQCDELYGELGVKLIPRKSGIATAIREGKMFEIFREWEWDKPSQN